MVSHTYLHVGAYGSHRLDGAVFPSVVFGTQKLTTDKVDVLPSRAKHVVSFDTYGTGPHGWQSLR